MTTMKSFALFCSIICYSASGMAQSNNCPCCTEHHSEFDFWVGSWEVTSKNGTPAGTNSIVKDQDNCMLRENWISATPGYTGTSTNFYNSLTNQWEQLWIDNQGGSLHLKGNRIGNQMILESTIQKNAKGQPYFHRITWTKNDDGSVRQYWETVLNETEITVAFDGLYKKTQ